MLKCTWRTKKMSVVVLNIKNEEKGKFLLDFLKQIEFIDIEEPPAKKIKTKEEESFRELFGIWKDRDIDLETIRKKAWKVR
jgi:hypothetical protein